MNDDYLWDRSGPVDPEIERLERALAPLRGSDEPRPDLELQLERALAPGSPGERPPLAVATPAVARPRRRWALAGGVALAGAAGVVLWRGHRGGKLGPGSGVAPAPAPAGWILTVVAGRPHIDGHPVAASTRLGVGQTLETDEASRAQLVVPDVGTVLIDPSTRVRLVGTGNRAHRLGLAGGVLHGTIFAPPGTFFIETPAGVAVDLGCVYTVAVAPDGDGLVTVQAGWVGFQRGGRESFIPEGASCAIRVRTGPGTPCFLDAGPIFRGALAAFDTSGAAREQHVALQRLLPEARPRDAVTLWHLLLRAPLEARAGVLDRLRALVPAAGAVPAARVLAGERKALEELWDHLDLGPIALWRRWKADLDRDSTR